MPFPVKYPPWKIWDKEKKRTVFRGHRAQLIPNAHDRMENEGRKRVRWVNQPKEGKTAVGRKKERENERKTRRRNSHEKEKEKRNQATGERRRSRVNDVEMRHTCQGHACVCSQTKGEREKEREREGERKEPRKGGAKSETETGTSGGETNDEWIVGGRRT